MLNVLVILVRHITPLSGHVDFDHVNSMVVYEYNSFHFYLLYSLLINSEFLGRRFREGNWSRWRKVSSVVLRAWMPLERFAKLDLR